MYQHATFAQNLQTIRKQLIYMQWHAKRLAAIKEESSDSQPNARLL